MAKKKAKAETYPLERVRNIGIIAHIDGGKTTTTEQILYYTGKEHRIGSVDEGSTTTDHLEQEQERGITIVSAAVTVHWTPPGHPEHRINIIDTPGHIDFTAEVERSLNVLDGAIAIYCAVNGVQAQSETVWRQANTYGVPRIGYVNKLDRAGANFFEVLSDIEERLPGMVPLAVQVPIGEEKEFRGVVDLITQRAWTWEEGSPPPPPTEGDVPGEVADEVQLYREQLLERLGDLDDTFAAVYMEGEADPDEVRAALRRVTIARTGFPVLCGASFRHKGVQPLLDAICAYLPSPLDRPPVAGKRPKSKRRVGDADLESWDETTREPSPTAHFCAMAFKTVSQKTADLVFLRVYSGTVTAADQLLNINKNKKERLGRIHVLHANRKEPVDVATAGDILGIVGLRYTVTGDTLCDPGHPIRLGAITFPLPVVSMAVEPRSTKDKDKLADALMAMAKDDPTFTVREDADTGQTLISGMGELHLEIIADRLRRTWNVEAKVGKPRVSYKATIRQAARGEGSYELVVGEKRQFGAVTLEVARQPGAPGGLVVEFPLDEDADSPHPIPLNFHPAIEEAVRTKASSVGDYGDPLIDCRVRVTGGTADDDASEGAFAAAASRAVEDALGRGGLVFLEPIMTLTVDVPEEFYGNIVQDLQGRRATVLSAHIIRESRRVVAAVPLAEMFGYVSDMRSKSQGRANASLEPRDYAEVPEGKRPKLF